jgi:WD40 repeat protein
LAAIALLVLLALVGLSLFAAKRAAAGVAEAKTQREEAGRQQRLAGEATKQRLESDRLAKAASDRAALAQQAAAEQERRAALAREAADVEEQGTSVLRRFQAGSGELDALADGVAVGRRLLRLIAPGTSWTDYPALAPVAALNTMLATIRERRRFPVGGLGLQDVTLSHDGRRIALIRNDDRFVNGKGSLWVSDLAGTPLWHCTMPDTAVNGFAFDRTGDAVVLDTQSRGLEHWDRACTPVPAPPDGGLPLDRRGHLFAGSDGPATIVTNARAATVAKVTSPERVQDLRVHPDGRLILAPQGPRLIVAWRETRWEPFFDAGERFIQDFAFTGDGQLVVVELRDGPIRILDRSGVQQAAWDNVDGVHPLWISPTGDRFATAAAGAIKIWEADRGPAAQFAESERVDDVQFVGDGSRLAVVAFDRVRFVTATGEPLFELAGHEGAVRRLFFTPDEQSAITAGADSTVRLWDLSQRPSRRIATASRPEQRYGNRVREVAFLPERGELISANEDGHVAVWTKSGRQLREWKTSETIERARISGDGKQIALIHDGRVEVRDLAGSILSADPPGAAVPVLQAAFSRDGRMLALSRAGGSVEIRTRASGAQVRTPTPSWVMGLAFDTAGARVAAALGTGTVLVLDRDGKIATRIEARHGQLLDVAFSGDGRYLATAGADGAIRV